MNTFERNSIHLNSAGYKFGMGMISGATAATLSAKYWPMTRGAGNESAMVVPLWVNPNKTTDTQVTAILGSEPKIGENEEVTIPISDINNLVYVEPTRFRNGTVTTSPKD